MISRAVCSWDYLGDNEKNWLISKGFDSLKWEKLNLDARNSKMREFAAEEGAKLLSAPATADKDALNKMYARYLSLRQDLDGAKMEELDIHFNRLKILAEVKEKAGEALKDAPAELEKFKAGLEELEGLPVSDRLAGLNRLFENTPLKAQKPKHWLIPEESRPPAGNLPKKTNKRCRQCLRRHCRPSLRGRARADVSLISTGKAGRPSP